MGSLQTVMALHYFLLAFSTLLSSSWSQNLVCQKEVWKPADEPAITDDGCEPYDGSLVPDCEYFLNNYTSYYHTHEYDCSLFWECGPSGPCLTKCAECPVSTSCPDGFLNFDCRYVYPEGPVCDWPNQVNCTNDTPCDINLVECCSDADCPVNSVCIGNSCETNGPTPTPGPTTTTQCPTDCCADEDCDPGYVCENGSCVEECLNECCADEDCPAGYVCNDEGNCIKPTTPTAAPTTTTPDCSTECCKDEDCPAGQTCSEDGTCFMPSTSPTPCPTECCADEDCEQEGFVCNENGTCECGAECCSDDDCQNGETCQEDGTCTCPNDCCADEDCPAGFVCDNGSCECSTECCSDADCINGQECQDDGTCACPTECCVTDDCPDGYICDEHGNCKLEGECDENRPCPLANGTCSAAEVGGSYTTCEYCDPEDKLCKPGCETDDNCMSGAICTHNVCQDRGVNGIVTITVMTESCSGCAGEFDEGGVAVYLEGRFDTSCNSVVGLDNNDEVDYKNGHTALFDGKPDNDGSDDGMGGCKGADLNYGLLGGTATWMGQGTWTAAVQKAIYIDFYDPDNDKPTCCCELKSRTLGQNESSELENCDCQV